MLKIPPEEDPRHKLVDWMAQPDNPFFAQALVNRMWGHLLGRGLVDPVDDMRETNPPSNPELLDALAQDFIKHKFDVKHVVRTICNSRHLPAQLDADAVQPARQAEPRPLLRPPPDRRGAARRVDQVCGTRTRFNKMSKQAGRWTCRTRASARTSWTCSTGRRAARPASAPAATGANLSQVLHLAMSAGYRAEDRQRHRPSGDADPAKGDAEKAVEEIYLAAYSRTPTARELQFSLDYLQRQPDVRRGLEDLVWSIMNSREFMFNH